MSVKAARGAAGYSLVEVLMVSSIMAVVAAMAVPMIEAGMRRYALQNASQQLASAIRAARYTAVSKNKNVRLRFNCPEAGQYRMVEVTTSSAIDEDSDRCSNTAYPYPDPDGAMPPNLDGPVLVVPPNTDFSAVTDIEISVQGRLTALTGCPTCTNAGSSASITLNNGSEEQTVSVSATGQVEVEAMEPID